jgi:hypothetical protein
VCVVSVTAHRVLSGDGGVELLSSEWSCASNQLRTRALCLWGGLEEAPEGFNVTAAGVEGKMGMATEI